MSAAIKSILVIKPSSLGDVVHTLPAVARLRAAHPEAKITWVINPEWAPLLRGNPDVDHVHIFPRGDFRGLGAPRSLIPWLAQTHALKPDVAADFQGLLRSALIAKISGAKECYGMSDSREGSRWFYDCVTPVDRRAHAVDRYLELAKQLGAKADSPVRFALPTGESLPRFDSYPPFVALHPFARGERKSLSSSVIEQLCAALAPIRVVIVGRSSRRLGVPDNCVNLTNQTSLLQLVWVLRAAAFTISVDSGPMHIAAAVSDNLLSIHTWTDPARVGPYNRAAWIWKNGEVKRVRELDGAIGKKKGRSFRAGDIGAVLEALREARVLPA